MTTVEVFRRVNDQLVALTGGPNGYLCSEGEMIVFRTRTTTLPRMYSCGETMAPKNLSQNGELFTAEFERLIDTWAGRTVFSLEGGPAPERLQLDIGPHEKKLGPGAWEALIQELCQISETLPWGLSPGEATGRMTPDALVSVHPAIIEHLLSVFCQLLRQLLADPPSRTLRIRVVRPLDLSKRADLQTIRWLSRRPLELAGIRRLAPDDQPPNPRMLVDQPDTTTSQDHPITRYVAYLLDKVRRRLATTASSLKMSPRHGVPDPAVRRYADELAERVEKAQRSIEAVRRAPLFRAVQPEPLSDAVLQSLPDHPLYSAIHRVGRQLAAPGLAYAPGQDIQSALKRSYDLFELVVLYRLVAAIREGLGSEWHAHDEAAVGRLPHEDRPADQSVWSWRTGDGWSLELRYQALFRSTTRRPDKHQFSSLSAQGVPDYVLILRRDSTTVSWIILDAKYRSGRQSIHDALGDMHRYRDALRVSGSPADAAFIIVPALQPRAALYGQPAFLRSHRFGALRLYEEGWIEPVWTWLRAVTGGLVAAID